MANEEPKRIYRDTEHRKIAGVCAGIARYINVDPLIVRVVFAASILFSGLGLIVYLVAWLIMTPAPEDYWSDDVDRPGRRIYKDPDDKKVFGVCGGIAKAYDVDPTIVRLVFVVLAFLGGAGILAYLVLAVLLDAPPVEPQVDVDEDDEQDDGTNGPEASDDDGDGDSGDEPAAETGDEPAGDAGE